MDETIIPLDETENLPGILSDIAEGVGDAWVEIDAHPGLDDDQRADLTRHFETIEEAAKEARGILGVSSENDT